MDSIIVLGGNRLTGTVEIEGAKNAALPILAASILGENKPSKFTNIPLLSDVYIMKEVLQYLNIEINFDENEKTMMNDTTMPLKSDTTLKIMNKIHASIVVI